MNCVVTENLKTIEIKDLKQICGYMKIYHDHLSKENLIVSILERIKYYEEKNEILGLNMIIAGIKTYTKLSFDENNYNQLLLSKRLKLSLEDFIVIYGEEYRNIVNKGIIQIDEIEKILIGGKNVKSWR